MWLALRRLALAGSGLTFLLIALAALVAPHPVAAAYGYELDQLSAFNEFRAVFTGFWLGLSLMLFVAARRPDQKLLGDLCGAAIGLQGLARLTSLALDGYSGVRFVAVALLELGTAALILAGTRSP